MARAEEVIELENLLQCECRLLAHSDALRQRSTSVAFRAKRTLTNE